MYRQKIKYNDFFDQAREAEVFFNLTSHEVFKLLVEFQAVFEWTEKMQDADPNGVTDTAEVIEFYNNVEAIILAAYGQPDPDGLHFRKGGVYDFRESALFHKCMVMFVEDPAEANKLIDGLMPKDFQELVKRADANLAELAKKGGEGVEADLATRFAALQAEVAAQQAGQGATPVTPGAQG